MHCPRCGQQVSDAVRFCRSCGLSLEGVGDLLVPEAQRVKVSDLYLIRTGFRRGFPLIFLAFVIAFLNLGLQATGLLPEIYGKVAFFTFLFAGLLRMVYNIFSGKAATARRERISTLANPPAGAQFQTNALPALPGSRSTPIEELNGFRRDTAEMVERPSVTEHTTELLTKTKESS